MLLLLQGAAGTPVRVSQTTVVELRPARRVTASQTTIVELRKPEPLYASQTTVVKLRSVLHRVQQTTHVALLRADDPSLIYGWPTPEVRPGQVLEPLRVSCELGQALSVSYEDSGAQQTGQITFPGREVTAGSRLPLTISGGGSRFSITLDVDKSTIERRQDEQGAWTHTLRLHNAHATRIASETLPELVLWHQLLRRAEMQGLAPRRANVSQLVRRAFAEVGCTFTTIGPDPLADMEWAEGQRDYSTDGKTARQVFDDAYGPLGRLIVRGQAAYFLPHGSGQGGAGGAEVGRCALTGLSETETWAHVPAQIRASAPDRRVLVETQPEEPEPDTEEVVDPETGERLRQLTSPDYDPDTNTLTKTVTTFGEHGEPIERVTIKTGDVTVPLHVDGQRLDRIYRSALLEGEASRYHYDPDNPQMLVREEVRRIQITYDGVAELDYVPFGGRYYSGEFEAGAVVADEHVVTQQYWYDRGAGKKAGYLRRKLTAERRLADIQQENADGDPDMRGKPEARNYVTRTYSEEYLLRNGVWWRFYSEGGGGNIAVYEKATGEAVKLIPRSSTDKSGSEPGVTPPKVDWPGTNEDGPPEADAACETRGAEVSQGVRTMLVVPAGRGGTQSISFPYAANLEQLQRLTWLYAAGQGHRTALEYSLAVATNVQAGQTYAGGTVDRVSISQGQGGAATSSVQVTRQLHTGGRFTRHPTPHEATATVTRRVNDHTVEAVMIFDEGVPSTHVFIRAGKGEEPPSIGSSVSMMLSSDGYWVPKGGSREQCLRNMGASAGVLPARKPATG